MRSKQFPARPATTESPYYNPIAPDPYASGPSSWVVRKDDKSLRVVLADLTFFLRLLRSKRFSPRLVCVAVLGLIALCTGRLVPALAVPVDVTHLLTSCMPVKASPLNLYFHAYVSARYRTGEMVVWERVWLFEHPPGALCIFGGADGAEAARCSTPF